MTLDSFHIAVVTVVARGTHLRHSSGKASGLVSGAGGICKENVSISSVTYIVVDCIDVNSNAAGNSNFPVQREL